MPQFNILSNLLLCQHKLSQIHLNECMDLKLIKTVLVAHQCNVEVVDSSHFINKKKWTFRQQKSYCNYSPHQLLYQLIDQPALHTTAKQKQQKRFMITNFGNGSTSKRNSCQNITYKNEVKKGGKSKRKNKDRIPSS